MLTLCDDFSSWIECFPLKNQTSEEVATCIIKYGLRHGFPRHIKSDKGSSIISNAMQIIYRKLRVKSTTSSSIHPESHGRIERIVKHVRDSLAPTLAGDRQWDERADEVAAAWNWTPGRVTMHSPFEVIHGHQPRFLFEDTLPLIEGNYTVLGWVKHKSKYLKAIHANLLENSRRYKLQELHENRKRWKEKNTPDYEVGDRVKIYLPVVPTKGGLASKLQARYTPEYEIVRKVGPYTYHVKKANKDDTRRSVAIHVSRMKLMYKMSRTHDMTPICRWEEECQALRDAPEIEEEIAEAALGFSSKE